MNYLKLTPLPFRPSNRMREYHARLVEIIRQNPGIRIGEIAKLFYPDKIKIGAKQRERLVGMLITLQCDSKIEHIDDRYYVLGPADWKPL